MPEADAFEAPQGGTFHERLLEAITEAFAGNGITNNGDALATTDPDTNLKVDVTAANGLRFDGESYDPDAASFTLSPGPDTTTNGEDDRRADLLYFDPTGGGDGSFDVLEGTPDPNPVPPDTPDDGLMVAVIDVDHDADDVVDDDVINWRARPAVTYQTSTEEIQDGAVTTSKINDSAVVTAKIATDAVTNDKVADDAIDTVQIADEAVVRAKIGDAAVGTDQLGSAAVTTDKIGDGAVVTAKIDGGAVTNDEVADDAGIARTKIVRNRLTTTVDHDYTTEDGVEVVLVETSNAPHTVTLSEDDVEDGRVIHVVDIMGDAEDNPITVDTEGSATIDGEDTREVDTEYGGVAVVSDGTNWFTVGGGTGGGGAVEVQDDGDLVVEMASVLNFGENLDVTEDDDNEVTVDADFDDPADLFRGSEGGDVDVDEQGVVGIDRLADTETVEVKRGTLTTATAEAVADGVDLILVTLADGEYTERDTVFEGDGSTLYDGETGDPLAEYTNTTGGSQTIGVLVRNESGSTGSVYASFEGRFTQ